MQATRNKTKPKLSQIVAEFPRRHLLLASIALLSLFAGLLLTPGDDAQARRTAQPLTLQLDAKVAAEPIIEVKDEAPWTEIAIRDGDNLSTLFQRASLSARDVYQIVNHSDDSKSLLKLYPGQKLAFQTNDEGSLQTLKHIQNKFDTVLYERNGDHFQTSLIQREPEVRQKYSSSVISTSLFTAAQNSGLSQNLIMELANIFGGVVDFVYDVRVGDSFTLLYQEHYLDDEKTGNGPILAAQFTNRGETYTAYRYVYEDGSSAYFNEEGVSMRKAFLRSPLDFTRISSNFNLKRLHPIFKTTKPHRGIDYAASRGTPVYAAGDGRVTRAGFSNANGNYVVINHGTQYQTKYLHLHKRGVRKGQKVKQRQIIGWVGSTGYATGPHLHYEFLVNGTHRNPRTILKKLPKAKSIDDSDKPRFLAQINSLQIQLAAYNSHSSFAKAEQATESSTL